MASGRLYRFGMAVESAEKLAADAAKAEGHGFPHGVSAFDRTSRGDAVSAAWSAVEALFRIVKTGRNPYHYTIVLPKPVTGDVAQRFNAVFGRM